jgi:hypothetical protein
MNMKKVSQKAAEPEQSGLADAVPAETSPKPPTTYVARVLGRGPIGYRPQRAQRQVALKAAKELSTSTQYAARFGTTAPDQGEVADALTTASGWSTRAQEAKAWCAYVTQQEATAWMHAGGLLDALKVPFEFAQSRDVTVKSKFPNTSQFFSFRTATALRGAATKRAKKAAKTETSTQASTTAAASGEGTTTTKL